MKFGKYNFKSSLLSKILDISVAKPPESTLINQITIRQILRQKEDIKNWRNAIRVAESVLNPDRRDIIRIYDDAVLDAHLDSLMSTAHLAIMAGDFWLEDEKGVKDDEQTKKIQTEWFMEYAQHTINALFYGFSLIEFGEIKDDAFTSVTNFPREFVIPETMSVKQDLGTTKNQIPFNEEPFNQWNVFIWRKNDLGILVKSAPHVIWKKNVMVAWSEMAEIFGMPIRIGKTDIQDPDKRKNMEIMLATMGSAAQGVFDLDDNIEMPQMQRTDAFRIYNMLVERTNSEMSKSILGQTMTTDDGSSKSQAQVHKDIFDVRIKTWRKWFKMQTNKHLIPLMLMHGMIPPKRTFNFDSSPSPDEVFEKIIKLAEFYVVDPEFIEEGFGIPVTTSAVTPGGFEANAQELADIMASSKTMRDVMAIYNENHDKKK